MRDRVCRSTALLLTGTLLVTLTGCSVRVQRRPDWDRPAIQVPAGSLRAFIRQTNRWLEPEMVERIAVALVRECEAQHLDPRVVAALISRESSFNPKATNPSGGAKGLGQLMPDTARWLGVQDPYDPEQNIAGICKYIAHLRDFWSAMDWERILASYRLGQGTVRNSLKATGTIPPTGLSYARDILSQASRITS